MGVSFSLHSFLSNLGIGEKFILLSSWEETDSQSVKKTANNFKIFYERKYLRNIIT